MCDSIRRRRLKAKMKLALTMSSVALAVLAICFSVLAWRILHAVWLTPKRLEKCLRQQGLSGTPYRSLIGDVREMARMNNEALSRPMPDISHDLRPRLLPLVVQSMEKYGKSSFTWMGPIPTVTVMDDEAIKAILTRVHEFRKPSVKAIQGLLLNGILMHEGAKWAKHRKIINPAFHVEKLKLVVEAACLSSQKLTCDWENLILAGGHGSCELDILPHIGDLTADVISRTAFGSSYGEGRKIFLLQEELIRLFFENLKFAFIPGWRYLPSKPMRRMKQIIREINPAIERIVRRRRESIEEGTDDRANDLLGLLLRSSMKEIQDNGREQGISDEEIVEHCRDFYLAGQDSTAALLTWTLILLSKHGDWQQRAREEVLQVFGREKPEHEGLNRLKIVSMILNEVLRLYPPVSTLRTVDRTTRAGKLCIPPGVHVSIPMLLIHHDPERWGDDAHEFNPERFSDGVSKATGNKLSFIPFSWGPRTCIGLNFAQLEAKVVLVYILQNFILELSESYVHAPVNGLVIRPEFGAPVILRRFAN